jgi:hypothetical protein
VTAEVGDARRLTQWMRRSTHCSCSARSTTSWAERIAALAEGGEKCTRPPPWSRPGPGGVLLAAAIGRFIAVLNWAQSDGLTADVPARLVPLLSTGVHDPTLGFTHPFFPTLAQPPRMQVAVPHTRAAARRADAR